MRKLLAAIAAIGASLLALFAARPASASVGSSPSSLSPASTSRPATKAPPEPAPPVSGPRGIRNRNPGNIRTRGTRNGLGGRDPWRGLIDEDDEGYGIFESAVMGIRAIGKELITGMRRDGENTVRQIITEWAPSTENNTAAYIASVSKQTGYAPDLPLGDDALAPLTRAIIRHENGQQPYPDALIAQALYLARTT